MPASFPSLHLNTSVVYYLTSSHTHTHTHTNTDMHVTYLSSCAITHGHALQTSRMYCFTKQKEQNSSRLKDSEKGLVVTEGEGLGKVGGEGEGIKGHNNLQSQYNLVTGMAVQHGEYIQ